jgi:uncharacterized membrane protein YkvA (DUF1232 family)
MSQVTQWFDTLKLRARQLKREVSALSFAYRDPRTPWFARLFASLVIAYLLSPIDLIPDFIPILGYLDDLLLVPLGITISVKMIPPEVMADARRKADEAIPHQSGRWWYAIPILLVWLVLIAALAQFFWGLFHG